MPRFLAVTLLSVAVLALAGQGRVALAAPPANDNLASAASVASLPFSASADTTQATAQAGESNPTCEVGLTDIGNTIWYKHTAAASGSILADTTGSNFDTVVAVYSGPSSSPTFGALTFVACDDDSGGAGTSAKSFAATSGTTYYFQVGGSAAEFGSLVFSLAAPSSNDNLAGATSALPLPYAGGALTTAATVQASEPSPTCESGATFIGKTVWWKFTPSSNMALTANTYGSNFDTVLAVYSGPSVSPAFGTLSLVTCADQSGGGNSSAVVFSATGGTTYYFQAGGAFGDSGNLVFNLAGAADADLDGVADASDNCPAWPNTAQNLPSWTVPADDADCDGWTATREQHVGTDPAKHCNATSTANDEADAWPTDFNDNQVTNLADVVLFGPTFSKVQGNPGYNQRFDLNANNSITLHDVVLMSAYFNRSCTS